MAAMDMKKVQEEEIEAMKAIFIEEFDAIDSPTKGGTLLISPDVTEHFKITWQEKNGEAGKEQLEMKEMGLENLSPFILIVRFPKNYPFEKPPDFSLMCDWLNGKAVAKLCEALIKTWEINKEVILYKWALFLKEEAMTFLRLESQLSISDLLGQKKISLIFREPSSVMVIGGILTTELNFELTFDDAWELYDDLKLFVKNAVSPPEAQADTKISILDLLRRSIGSLPEFLKTYNEHKLQQKFNFESFECSVCFVSAPGKRCVRFHPCGHVFCQTCVQRFLEVTIREGRVESLHCLAFECSSPVMPNLVKASVSGELFKIYDELLFAVSLSVMGDIIFCPRPACQNAVIFNETDPMAMCTTCDYAFCHHCKMGYHALELCRVRAADKENLVKMYLEADEKEKREIEKKHGKRPMQLLVDNVLSQRWIENHSKACPQCKASIEKRDGCNKMKCWRCMTPFCWLCRKQINSANPYDHFLDGSTRCYGKLFQ